MIFPRPYWFEYSDVSKSAAVNEDTEPPTPPPPPAPQPDSRAIIGSDNRAIFLWLIMCTFKTIVYYLQVLLIAK